MSKENEKVNEKSNMSKENEKDNEKGDQVSQGSGSNVTVVSVGSHNKCYHCMEKMSDAIIGTLEKLFYKMGVGIGRYPWVVILCCILVVMFFVPGIFLFFTEETAQDKLWVPFGAQSIDDKAWVADKFPSYIRFNTLIVETDNILKPEVIKGMLVIDQEIKAIKSDENYDWESICAKLGTQCWSNSILELWSFDEATINALTETDILDKVNTVEKSPIYNNDYNASQVLGSITRDSDDKIVGAQATSMTYFLKTNVSDDSGEVDPYAEEWELEFLDIAKAGHSSISKTFYFATRSFGDEGGGAILGDIAFLGAGYMIIIVFVAVVLGKFNHVHQRIWVSLGGVICVGLAVAFSIGLCSYCGVAWGPVHSVLPFLLIGIGVDDMFVIIQSMDKLRSGLAHKPLKERIGHTLKHAGVSITVTSLTDILAFGVGASTVLPALRSFCIYCAVGVLATFIFQATFFVACVCIDEWRASQDRNACCLCFKHKNYKPSDCSQKSLTQIVFDKYYTPFLLKLPVKIVVTIVSFGILGASIYGVIMLKQEFDFRWFLPTDSYATEYFDASEKHFPNDGINTAIYLGDIDYYNKYNVLEQLHKDALNDPFTYEGTVDSWFYSFRVWMNDSRTNPAVSALVDSNSYYPTSEDNFYTLLAMFMYSPPYEGIRFSRDMVFDDDTNHVVASKITLKHRNLDGAAEEIDAMESLQEVAASTGMSREEHECFAYTSEYLGFETNKVIQFELYRNLGLAFLCVFIMILLLIANIWTCLLVCFCILCVLVDVGGFMYFWGLTIDTVTSINLILAIGLAVDYSAHIGHTFMTEVGTRNERVLNTMSDIGPAVFYGGVSTFLAFVLLAVSTSYVFLVFFKIFFLVVLFGVYHGLVFLPVLLSWMGPPPYISAQIEASEIEKENSTVKPPLDGAVVENGSTTPIQSEKPKANEAENGFANHGYEKDERRKSNAISPVST